MCIKWPVKLNKRDKFGNIVLDFKSPKTLATYLFQELLSNLIS